ncbi:DDE-type integrase/transposase/recombinase (plasmid) [Acinetobacter baumannii]
MEYIKLSYHHLNFEDRTALMLRALALLKREGRCPSDVEHRQIKYRNNVIECDHGKLKRIINATLGFKSMKTAYATIKGIEVMRALRKGQASAFYYGDPLGSRACSAQTRRPVPV